MIHENASHSIAANLLKLDLVLFKRETFIMLFFSFNNNDSIRITIFIQKEEKKVFRNDGEIMIFENMKYL